MMNVLGLIFLLFAHYITGKGLLRLFKTDLEPLPSFCLSMMCGIPILSFAPCFVQMLKMPIETTNVVIAIICETLLFSIPLLYKMRRPRWIKLKWPKVYELPFLLVTGALIMISVWRCFYYPVYSRDMLSGPELLAEYAVREKTMISSVFNVDLSTTNNYFKSSYITGLQIEYKLLVSPFGQVWLSVLFVPFMVWLYLLLKERLHPLLAGFLLLLFLCTPEMYSYTYNILYDYSNMVFFFLGYYFLARYVTGRQLNELLFSAMLFGLATYIRTETLILVGMICPLLLYYNYRGKLSVVKNLARTGLFVLFPLLFYVVCIYVFIPLFIPLPFDLGQNINPDLGNVSVFFKRASDMASTLIFSGIGLQLYGGIIIFFCGCLLSDMIWFRKLNTEALLALYGIFVVYIGLAFIGYLLPLADLENTTKRGLFKLLPLMLLYMSNSGTLQALSRMITKWESAQKPAIEPVTGTAVADKPRLRKKK